MLADSDLVQVSTTDLPSRVWYSILTALDSLVYLFILTQQLFYQLGFTQTVQQFIRALPFLLFQLPLSFFYGPTRPSAIRQSRRNPDDLVISMYHDVFAETHSYYEVAVVRCVRWGLENLPMDVARVFMSNNVSRSPITRQLRVAVPVFYDFDEKYTGVWIKRENNKPSDIVIYYVHGGGFVYGSAAFYLEWLAAWFLKLEAAGYKNPSVFAIDYSLAPEVQHPVQVRQVLRGYQYATSMTEDESNICVAADDSGAYLVMSLRTALGSQSFRKNDLTVDVQGLKPSNPVQDHRLKMIHELLGWSGKAPGIVVLISPWLSLVSEKHHPTASDYLTPKKLHELAALFAPGLNASTGVESDGATDKLILTVSRITATKPKHGYVVWMGKEEVLADDIRSWVSILRNCSNQVIFIQRAAGIHSWTAASFFIRAQPERLDDLALIIDTVKESISPEGKTVAIKKHRRNKWPIKYSKRGVSWEKLGEPDKAPTRKVSAASAMDVSPKRHDYQTVPAVISSHVRENSGRHGQNHHHKTRRFSLRRNKGKGKGNNDKGGSRSSSGEEVVSAK